MLGGPGARVPGSWENIIQALGISRNPPTSPGPKAQVRPGTGGERDSSKRETLGIPELMAFKTNHLLFFVSLAWLISPG